MFKSLTHTVGLWDEAWQSRLSSPFPFAWCNVLSQFCELHLDYVILLWENNNKSALKGKILCNAEKFKGIMIVILLVLMKWLDYFSALFQSPENVYAEGTSQRAVVSHSTPLNIAVLKPRGFLSRWSGLVLPQPVLTSERTTAAVQSLACALPTGEGSALNPKRWTTFPSDPISLSPFTHKDVRVYEFHLKTQWINVASSRWMT